MNTMDLILKDKATILVVDDMPDNLTLMSGLIEDNYKVKIATNGEKALAIATSDNPPDLILLDVVMPEMDGYEVCRRLQDDPKTRSIPVIFISAKADMKDEKRGLDLGAVDYIAKPYRTPIVLARVRTHIRLKKQSDMLEALAMIDGLTHIPNRRRFNEALHDECRRSCRNNTSLSLLMVCADFFKAYNDHYGHGMGDACLTKISEALAAICKRPGDLAARYGGDEFAAVLPNTDSQGARHLAEHFRVVLESMDIPHAHSGIADHVTVSVGFAAAQSPKKLTASAMLRRADRWLEQAKNNGRNRVEGGACTIEGEQS